MDASAGKLVATEENQVLWAFSESQSWSIHEDEVTGKLVAYKTGVVKLAASSISENSGNRVAERKNGHMISTYLLQLYLTWTKSIRLSDRLTIEDPRTKWTIST